MHGRRNTLETTSDSRLLFAASSIEYEPAVLLRGQSSIHRGSSLVGQEPAPGPGAHPLEAVRRLQA
eukprot:624061-Prymnesium_polylepis.1